jgi:hypothetical protein
MSDKPHFPKITARSIEEFTAIEKKLRELPQVILDQIEVAYNHVYTTCVLSEVFDSNKYITLPNYVTQIKPSFKEDKGLEVLIYAGDFLFKIDWSYKKDATVNYLFIDCKPKV